MLQAHVFLCEMFLNMSETQYIHVKSCTFILFYFIIFYFIYIMFIKVHVQWQ
jgi:hypothetical protein